MTIELIAEIFGGPDAGKIIKVTPGMTAHWAYRENAMAPFVAPGTQAPEMPKYHYTLSEYGDRAAFMPRDDADLIQAFKQATGTLGNASDALSAEIKRRGLTA